MQTVQVEHSDQKVELEDITHSSGDEEPLASDPRSACQPLPRHAGVSLEVCGDMVAVKVAYAPQHSPGAPLSSVCIERMVTCLAGPAFGSTLRSQEHRLPAKPVWHQKHVVPLSAFLFSQVAGWMPCRH